MHQYPLYTRISTASQWYPHSATYLIKHGSELDLAAVVTEVVGRAMLQVLKDVGFHNVPSGALHFNILVGFQCASFVAFQCIVRHPKDGLEAEAVWPWHLHSKCSEKLILLEVVDAEILPRIV